VHSAEATEAAIAASEVLFGKGDRAALEALDEATLLDVFAGVPHIHVLRTEFDAVNAATLLSEATMQKVFLPRARPRR
jgi:tyrosyl-tRNA synthetase